VYFLSVLRNSEMASRRSCKLDQNHFCYVCGRYVVVAQRCQLRETVETA
jgi:hypothetical protein